MRGIVIDEPRYCILSSCGAELLDGQLFYCCEKHRREYLKNHLPPSKSGPKEEMLTLAQVRREEEELRRQQLIEWGFTVAEQFLRAAEDAPKCSEKDCPKRLNWPGEIKSGKCLTHMQRGWRSRRNEKAPATTEKVRRRQEPHNRARST